MKIGSNVNGGFLPFKFFHFSGVMKMKRSLLHSVASNHDIAAVEGYIGKTGWMFVPQYCQTGHNFGAFASKMHSLKEEEKKCCVDDILNKTSTAPCV